MLACFEAKQDIVDTLIQKGADINAQCKLNGYTALMFLFSGQFFLQERIAIADSMLKFGADVNLKSWKGTHTQ
jgi:ankyrin repeat protein